MTGNNFSVAVPECGSPKIFENKYIQTMYEVMQDFIDCYRSDINIFDVVKPIKYDKKENISNTDFTKPAPMIERNPVNDRVFPLDTVTLDLYNGNHEKDLDHVVLHTGAYADEYARSVHALAFTVANHIFFRNGEYKPESEEGRVLLGHELTHVAQNKKRNDADNRSVKELENEAVAEEAKEKYNADETVDVNIDGKSYRLTKKQESRLKALADRKLAEWVKQQESFMSEEEYLGFLIQYQKYMENRR